MQYGVWYGADTQLQRRTVFDEQGDVSGDLLRRCVALAEIQFENRAVAGNQCVDFACVNKVITEHARHLLVDFGDHVLGRFGRGLDHVARHAVAEVAVFVRRTDGDQRNIDNGAAFAELVGQLGKKDRRVIGATGRDGVAHVLLSRRIAASCHLGQSAANRARKNRARSSDRVRSWC